MEAPGASWSGLVRCSGADEVQCIAHGQRVVLRHHGFALNDEAVTTFYDVKKSFDQSSSCWTLTWQTSSVGVAIPDPDQRMFHGVKDIGAGDQQRLADSRAKPSFLVLKMAWEQQAAALLLENVKGAKTANYIQEGIQRLARNRAILGDPAFGQDLRLLCQEDVCPCFLHSYSASLRGCPCGCREKAFQESRLLRDRVRGFYIVSHVTGKARWLHPREAALLCGLDPTMWMPAKLRAGLCLVGQRASPLQAAWMGAFLLDSINATTGSSLKKLCMLKMWLLRQAHRMVPTWADRPLTIWDDAEKSDIVMKLDQGCLGRQDGLGDQCIDKLARRMLAATGALENSTWVPAAQGTVLVNDAQNTWLTHWLVTALYGTLRSCVEIQRHWILILLSTVDTALHVTCWDGPQHECRRPILDFAERARQKLVLRTLIMSFNAEFSQTSPLDFGSVKRFQRSTGTHCLCNTMRAPSLPWDNRIDIVAANKSGIAFGSLEDVAPHLKEDNRFPLMHWLSSQPAQCHHSIDAGQQHQVLQPFKAGQYGQGWLVGAEAPPPSTMFQTEQGDVLVTLQKTEAEKQEQVILTSVKTKTYLKKTPETSHQSDSNEKENVMPWNGLDPWRGYNKFKEGGDSDQQMARSSKFEQLQSQVQDVVQTNLKDVTEQRFLKLESGMTELLMVCLLFGVTGAEAVIGQDQGVGQGEDPKSRVVPDGEQAFQVDGFPFFKMAPHMHSFTDQFLEFLKQREQVAEAVAQMDTDEQQEWGQADLPVEDGAGWIEGDVSVLQNQGGPRKWKFYRPDTWEMGRPLVLRLHVAGGRSLANTERTIVQRWPDLGQSQVQWKLLAIHRSIRSTIYFDEEYEAYLVEANIGTLTFELAEFQCLETYSKTRFPSFLRRDETDFFIESQNRVTQGSSIHKIQRAGCEEGKELQCIAGAAMPLRARSTHAGVWSGWEVLSRLGWRDAQDLAHELWGEEYVMNFGKASITDHVLISPELIPLVRDVHCWSWFADHAASGVQIKAPAMLMKQRVWPLPAETPCESIKYEEEARHNIMFAPILIYILHKGWKTWHGTMRTALKGTWTKPCQVFHQQRKADVSERCPS
eukprot:s345_g31.t1